jgi:hypothetical protein
MMRKVAINLGMKLGMKLGTKKIALPSLSKRIRITNPRAQHVLRYLRPPFCPTAAQ